MFTLKQFWGQMVVVIDEKVLTEIEFRDLKYKT